MTQESNTETTEVADEATGSNDSGVLKALRAQIKDLEKELKSRPDRDSLAAELRSELERDSQIKTQLVGFGHPAGILDVVKGKLGENEVTKETVAEALTGIGYQVEVDGAASSQNSDNAANQNEALATVSRLSAEVQSAASGGEQASGLQQIVNATSREELHAAAAAAGIMGEGDISGL